MGTAQKPLRYILRRGYKTKTSRDAAITSLYAAAEYADTLSLLPVKSLTAK